MKNITTARGLVPLALACLLIAVSTFWPSMEAQVSTPPLPALSITNDATAAQGLTNLVGYSLALKSNYGSLYTSYVTATNQVAVNASAAAADVVDKSNSVYYAAQAASAQTNLVAAQANVTLWSNQATANAAQIGSANSNALYYQTQNAGLVSNVYWAYTNTAASSSNLP